MLMPEEFGTYYATGSQKKSRGQAVFFELDPAFRDDHFRIEEGIRRCVPHEDGRPKASIYVSVYRVLEYTPLDVVGKLYLVTKDGRVLGLEPAAGLPEDTGGLHLYQEIAPVQPLVVSTLGPHAFYDLIVKTPTSLLTLPAICFVEMRLGELADDPEHGAVRDLPYENIDHLRQCLVEIRTKLAHTKMVNRVQTAALPYRAIRSGVFLGNTEGLLYFPLPSVEGLRTRHYAWWRSASM
jgi:hypothetical protein